jgi:hypothetical protein
MLFDLAAVVTTATTPDEAAALAKLMRHGLDVVVLRMVNEGAGMSGPVFPIPGQMFPTLG